MNSRFLLLAFLAIICRSFVYRPDIEAVWDAIVSGRSMYDPQQTLPVDGENFPSRDAVISLDQFVRFW